jgi:hypothetical protein
MVAVSYLSINGLYLWKANSFLEVPESLNVRVSLHTPCGKVTVCKNQDPVAVQNV